MAKVLVIYDSKSGNTEKMAQAVADGAKSAGAEVLLKKVDEAKVEDLLWADGIVVGSPNHFGSMTDNLKRFFRESVRVRRKLENKVGAAFTSTGTAGGGAETTIFSILQAMMIHGMIVAGDPMDATGHYGAIAVGAPDDKEKDICFKLGRRVAELSKKLFG